MIAIVLRSDEQNNRRIVDTVTPQAGDTLLGLIQYDGAHKVWSTVSYEKRIQERYRINTPVTKARFAWIIRHQDKTLATRIGSGQEVLLPGDTVAGVLYGHRPYGEFVGLVLNRDDVERYKGEVLAHIVLHVANIRRALEAYVAEPS